MPFRVWNSFILILIAICLLGRQNCFAQADEQPVVRHINEQNGLSDNKVQCIYKDKHNFLWVGTASGLNLVDGSDIIVFKHNVQDPASINDNSITAITGDNKGVIWVGTKRGLNSYDPSTNKFTSYPLHTSINTVNNYVATLAADKDDNIYIGTNAGLLIYNHATQKIVPLEVPGNKDERLINNNITYLAFDKKGTLWMTTFNGLWSFDRTVHHFFHAISSSNISLSTMVLNCLTVDHEGNLWMGTWDKILLEYTPTGNKVTVHPLVSPNLIYTIAEVKGADGKYILWTNDHRSGFDPQKGQCVSLTSPVDSSSQGQIDNLYVSNDNWFWIGTHNGLYFFNPGKSLFRHHRYGLNITGQGTPLLEWKNKLLVGGAGEYFLKEYDDKLNEVGDYFKHLDDKGISCLSLKFSGANTIRAGTTRGIADIDLLNRRVQFHHLDSLARKSRSGNFITGLFEDRTHQWWVFPWRRGIWLTDTTYNVFRQVFNNTPANNNGPSIVDDAVEDKDGNLWFADMNLGVIFYDHKTHRFSKAFAKQLGENFTVTQLLYDHDQCYIFLGTEIYRWHTSGHQLEKIELPVQADKPINAIAMDSIGNLWIATEKGLLSYNLKTKAFDRFTTADGLITNDMDGTLYCRRNGTMVFSAIDYLTAFNPAKILNTLDARPPLMLRELIAGGKPVQFDTSRKMSFNYTINDFTFRWSVTDFNDPLNNHYYYMLKGIDKDWRYTGNHGHVEFANLSSGNYVLLLKGENSNGLSSDKILTLTFEVRAPFWRTWWFIGMVVVSIIALSNAVYRYRLNNRLKLEKLRNKISLDLHDDIGSTLSSISILSEIASRQGGQAETVKMLDEIKENSLSLMERMDDIVWSINPKNDSLDSLFLRIKIISSKLFEARHINYNIHIGENMHDVHLPMEYRQHIYLIMKEAINNLVKYADCTEATIDVDYHSSHLNISVKDNGKGFNNDLPLQGNGIYSMRTRTKEMNAVLDIKTKPGKGTAISLSVKIK